MPDIFQQILEARNTRNPYRDISQKKKEQTARRSGEVPILGTDYGTGGPPQTSQNALQGLKEGGSEGESIPLSGSQGTLTEDPLSRIRNIVESSRGTAAQFRRQQQDKQVREMLDAMRMERQEGRSNALESLGQVLNPQGAMGGGHSHSGGIVKPEGMNGRLDTSTLVDVDGRGNLLQPAAASAWQRMVADAAREGINIVIGNSYRTFERQQELAASLGLYSQGGLAAAPGTSNHGWGTAVDIDRAASPGAVEWLQKNAARYGFYTIAREPWHWEYRG